MGPLYCKMGFDGWLKLSVYKGGKSIDTWEHGSQKFFWNSRRVVRANLKRKTLDPPDFKLVKIAVNL